MKRDARGVVLVDSDEDDVEELRESVHNLAVLNRYDYDQLERKIILEERHIVLISADSDPLVAISMALFAATKRITRIGVLSATNSLPPHLTDRPFMINGALSFFSNGGAYGSVLSERNGRRGCGICGGTGQVTYGHPAEADVCPRCGIESRTGKDWMEFIQMFVVKGPVTFTMPFPFFSGD